MGIFTKEEKLNMKTGKFETTKKGLFNSKKKTHFDQLVDDYKRKQRKAKNVKRKKAAKKAYKSAKGVWNYLGDTQLAGQSSGNNKKKKKTKKSNDDIDWFNPSGSGGIF